MSPPKASTVRCTLAKHAVWRALSSKAIHNIASVIILPVSQGLSESLSLPEILPSGISSSTAVRINSTEGQAEVERDLISALKKMSSLKHFTWRYEAGPVRDQELWSTLKNLGVPSIRIVDHKLTDFVGMPTGSIEYRSVFESDAFLSYTKLTSLELETKFLAGFDAEDDKKYLQPFVKLLENNAETLESLNLTFLNAEAHVDVTHILSKVIFQRLREITFIGASCTPQSLAQFLTAHPTIVSLSLSPMMAGRRWEQISLPAGSLPNLMHLNCSPFQAAKILDGSEASSRPLLCLTGIDVRQEIRLSEYFDNDQQDAYDEGEEVVEVDTYEADQPVTAPWRDELFSKLKTSKQITHIALNQSEGPTDLEVLAEIMPQVRWIDVGTVRKDMKTKGAWAKLGKFPELRTLHMRGTGLFLDPKPGNEKLNNRTADDIRVLAQACPNLKEYQDYLESVVVHREGGKVSLKVEDRGEPKDGLRDGFVWPSESFVRATTRKNAGPSQPGPGVPDAGYH
ncbi:hypothetical protein GYMLUDRAFT_47686 [Collybiopsis luxurians FD-317 M1]|uniref:F-box domain-containing protein n=1 Tax=Collybiopsis luxurians FD-317 M1 TaxID=944289 RepID=A0A0D0AY05_9AGAR|nr:hypothetical protein GYMLUDRAFT_47686 [Collybiopsis luxurians FD-317 M1]